MTLHVSSRDGRCGVVLLRVVGDIDMATRRELLAGIDGIATSGPGVVVDLLDVAFMDSSGIGALVHMSQDLGPGRLAVVTGDGVVSQVLAITAMDQMFIITDSVEQAERLLREQQG